MHREALETWQHDHTFGQDKKRPGESRTHIVIAITATMMIVEVIAGLAFGSMALLADGLHMASHACALTISAAAYLYTRRHARNPEFSFGAGKVNALGGFTGAVLLAVFAIMMGWESVARLLSPVGIAFNQAIGVAIVGLVVNGLCVVILNHKPAADEAHGYDHEGHDHEGHDHEGHHHEDHAHAHEDHHPHHHHGHGHEHKHDHNLRSAYLHVLADALTSILAIFALLAGKFYGLNWMDPAMGIVGGVLVARWSIGLLRTTSAVLLDRQAPAEVQEKVRSALEQDSTDRVADLHIWSIAPGLFSLEASIVAHVPQPPEHYKSLLPSELQLVHQTIEVHRCPDA